ncbi:MAG: hypothetical protein MI743_06400 [Sneathiellales bacterium]|nr:hypothetical protein [Sneathiellales bacterium]
MIFLTVGHELGFDRLVKAMDVWARENSDHKLFGQIGEISPDTYTPGHFEYQEFLSPAEFEGHFETSDVIVSHAGMGTIITALRKAKPIVLLPRKGSLRETRNDHQIATVDRFRSRDGIFVADEEGDLPEMLAQALDRSSENKGESKASDFASDELISALRDFIQR